MRSFNMDYVKKLRVEEKYSEMYLYCLANEDDALAKAWLGNCFYHGYGIEVDYNKSFFYDNESAKKGCDEGITNLALDYMHGIGAEKDYKKAIELLEKAAARKHPRAMRVLGKCYQENIGVEVDLSKAIEFYQEATSLGDAGAARLLGRCYEDGIGVEKSGEQAVQLYELAIERGDKAAVLMLAVCLEEGKGVEKNEERAVELYHIAVENGDLYANLRLGFCYRRGIGVENNIDIALKNLIYYTEHTETSHPELLKGVGGAWLEIASCYKDKEDEVSERDAYIKAIEIFSSLALTDDGYADEVLGEIRKTDCPMVNNYSKAFEHFERSYLKGNVKAAQELAQCYEYGIGVGKNKKKAFSIMKELVDANRIHEIKLAIYYNYGIGVTKNIRKAVDIYTKYIDDEEANVSSIACYCMGVCYYHGTGVKTDKEKALELFQKSDLALAEYYENVLTDAKREDYFSLYLAYFCNEESYLIKQDLKRAYEFCLKAYECSGKTRYKKALADCYFNGWGVKRNIKKAQELWREEESEDARQRYGECLYYSFSLKQRDAMKCFYDGAQNENSRAKVYMGLCYLNGCGVRPNLSQAIHWFNSAGNENDIYGIYGKGISALLILSNLSESSVKENEALLCLKEISKLDKLFDLIYGIYGKIPTEETALLCLSMVELDLAVPYRPTRLFFDVFKIQCHYSWLELKSSRSNINGRKIKTLLEELNTLRTELTKIQRENIYKDDVMRIKDESIAKLNREVEYYRDMLDKGIYDITHKVDEINIRTRVIENQLINLTNFVQSDFLKVMKENKAEFRKKYARSLGEEECEQLTAGFCNSVSAYIDANIKSSNELIEKEKTYLRVLFSTGWDKLQESSQTALVSAGVLWKCCANITSVDFDFSGVCISATSALEAEIKKYFFVGFQEYMKSKYGLPNSNDWKNTYQIWPELLLSINEKDFVAALNLYQKDPHRYKRPNIYLKNAESFTLGTLPYLFGVNKSAMKHGDKGLVVLKKCLNEYLSTIIVSEYEDNPIELLVGANTSESFIDRCERVRIKYRNPSAHVDVVSRDAAQQCYQEVIGKIEACQYTVEITSLLNDLMLMLK